MLHVELEWAEIRIVNRKARGQPLRPPPIGILGVEYQSPREYAEHLVKHHGAVWLDEDKTFLRFLAVKVDEETRWSLVKDVDVRWHDLLRAKAAYMDGPMWMPEDE